MAPDPSRGSRWHGWLLHLLHLTMAMPAGVCSHPGAQVYDGGQVVGERDRDGLDAEHLDRIGQPLVVRL